MRISKEAVDAAAGYLPAPIDNPEAWPPGYAEGFNEALKLVSEMLPISLMAARPHILGEIRGYVHPVFLQFEALSTEVSPIRLSRVQVPVFAPYTSVEAYDADFKVDLP